LRLLQPNSSTPSSKKSEKNLRRYWNRTENKQGTFCCDARCT